ncbi:response regulator|uniref:response regulator n=1 Tax=Pseudomonas sp. SbOxS1 TaxID=2723884 RepID=UPI0015D20D4A|nr:response regulator [Pseudomonas sp. SbOxS1]NYU02087.1 response regulator [Pseudomonas sp. SbOxS1]
MINDNLRIMVVEDHPFQLRATQCLLESYGFTHLTTSDCARNALQHMFRAEQPFDILLCDQCLPEVSGIDLIKIASHQGMIKQAILLSSLTSNELSELESQAILNELPLLGYLIKPLKQCELRQLLKLIP